MTTRQIVLFVSKMHWTSCRWTAHLSIVNNGEQVMEVLANKENKLPDVLFLEPLTCLGKTALQLWGK